MKILIDSVMKDLVPYISLGVIRYRVEVKKSDQELMEHLEKTIKEIKTQYEIGEIAELPHVRETREAYKALGKSPSQYRNAAEAMLRRIVKGNGLYQINNVVDINNLISIRSGFSIGTYDEQALEGEIKLSRAPAGERYEGIGKSEVNIENLPVLFDRNGAFGNPASDSKRAMIQVGNRDVITFLYAFSKDQKDLKNWLTEYENILERFTNASEISVQIIDR